MRFTPAHRPSRASSDNGGGAESPAGAVPGRAAPAAPGQASAPAAPGQALVLVPRWIQLVVLPLVLLGIWALARASGPILLIVVIASVIAIILNPLVKSIERVMPRGLAILAVYVGAFATLTSIGLLLSDPISDQVNHFANNVPHLLHRATHDLDSLQRWFNRHGIKVQIQKQGQTALQTLATHVKSSSSTIVSVTRGLLGEIITISIDFLLTLVLSVYLLVYAPTIGDLARRIMPGGDGTPADDYPLLIQRAVSGYLRGQLTFSTIMGASAAVALWILGVTGVFPAGENYALFFGAFYGLMEFIPYVGPIIGPIPAVAVALFNSPLSALWVLILFIVLQQLEGHLVAPQVFRISLQINPIIVILSLLIGYKLYGIAGALVALPMAAMARQTVIYLRRHLVLEPWAVHAPGGGVLQLAGSVCEECGEGTDPGDAFCRACGAATAQAPGTPARTAPEPAMATTITSPRSDA